MSAARKSHLSADRTAQLIGVDGPNEVPFTRLRNVDELEVQPATLWMFESPDDSTSQAGEGEAILEFWIDRQHGIHFECGARDDA